MEDLNAKAPDYDSSQKTSFPLSPQDIRKRFDKLKNDRPNWETQWQEIADYMNPNRNDITNSKVSGQKRTVQILDNTSMVSNELLAGALAGMLTNNSQPWLEYTTGDQALDQKAQVRKWLHSTAKRTLAMFNASNFQTEVHQFYLDLGSICTAGMFVEEDDDYVCRFSSQHIKGLFIEENNKGLVSEVYRGFKWSARNIVSEFGMDQAFKFDFIKKAYEINSDDKFEIIHAVYEKPINERYLFKYVSQYVLCQNYSNMGEQNLSLGGFNEFPYIVARWGKASGEKYGRGPGMIALPEQKLLNKMVETTLKGAQKSVDPPMQLPDDGVILPLKLHPGGINFRRPGTEPITPIFDNYRVDFGFQALEAHRQRVREAFYVDQLQLSQQGPQMTATEVMQRAEEKMRLLGPLLGRQEFEFLVPLTIRVFGIMNRRRLFEEMPEELRGKKIYPKYISTIARSQRLGELNSMLKGLQALAPVMQVDPEIADNFDADGYFKEVARIQSFPAGVIRSQDKVEERRKAKAQGMQDAQAAQMQNQQVDNISKLNKSQVNA